jgi:signal transduction histidine kinase
MTAIVEGLLTLARADAAAKPAARVRVDLRALVDQVVQLHRPLAAEHGVSVSVESSGEVAARGDPEGITELVTNLVTNAIRYNRRGGKVTIRLSAEAGRARIAVEDTGVGIADEHLSHIFDRFYRVDQARAGNGGGSGLGLAIVRAIADAHAGTIQVASREGVGTSFLVALPAAS